MPDLKWFIKNGDYFYFGNAPKHISGVSLDKNEISLVEVGETEQLVASIIPSDAVESHDVVWSSSDENVATVDENGLVTCVTPGDCTITVTTVVGGYTDVCVVKKADPITTPGIYYSSKLGLISISGDGNSWVTIADKNLGATTNDIESPCSYGNYYQWGNNYGWSYDEAIGGGISTSSTRVSTSGYGPNNYYCCDIFITPGNNDWSSNENADLWGDVTGTIGAKKGPCPDGFHIGDINEWSVINNIFAGWGATNYTNNVAKNLLKMPSSGFLCNCNGCFNANGCNSNFWTTTQQSACRACYVNPVSSVSLSYVYKSRGQTIRPIKDVPVQPDTSWEVMFTPATQDTPTVKVDVLMVGNGGSGGSGCCNWVLYPGGGGGGGGFMECCGMDVHKGMYMVGVGCTTFNGYAATLGGSGVGGTGSGSDRSNGGGSGGVTYNGTTIISGNSGAARVSGSYGGGGGGGAGGNASGMNGGAGKCSCLSGACCWYSAGGGGGTCYSTSGSPGTGGCGCGAHYRTCAVGGGTSGSGGGGGAAGTNNCIYGAGGAGGTFILRYPKACGYDIEGGCKYECGNYCIHCFIVGQGGILNIK